jgi:hypothetical protein
MSDEIKACELCGETECDCAEKNLDEEFLAEKLEEEGEVEGELEAKPEEKKEEEPEEELEVEPEEKPEVEGEEQDWMKQAAKAGWTPDHVREKHAREAQTLRDQVKNLQTIVNAAQRQEQEEIDPNEGVTRGELDEALGDLHNRAILSERVFKLDHTDYDEVTQEYLVPFVQKQPWIEEFLYNQSNPAKSAYEFATALKDGKRIIADINEDGLAFFIKDGEEEKKEEKQPERSDPNRPPVEALEQAAKQPKSIDSVPAAKSTEATQMSVEDFWNLPSDTLMRIRSKNPELYDKMREDFQEKYPG